MKQKNCFFAVAASMLIAAASFTSCSNQDNIVAPETVDYSFDEGSMILNGKCEVISNVANYWVTVGQDAAAFNGNATIKWDEETPKNHCVIVEARSESEAKAAGNYGAQTWMSEPYPYADHDTQFYITFGEENALNAKDQIRITMDVKADEEFTAGTGTHGAPGSYIGGGIGNVPFTTEWTNWDSGFVTISSSQAGAYSIAFNLANTKKDAANRFFFDNIRVEVKRFVPDPEPAKVEGMKVIFWNWGVAKQDQFSVKYFKNYTAPKAEDGAIVVESLDPEKNYNDTYFNANINGDNVEQIDAIVKNDHDVQFLIALPEPLAKGTKGKLVMKVKADKVAKAGTQCHTAIPVPGAIEGKNGYKGTYKHWAFMGDINFTTEWNTVSVDFTVPTEGDGVQAICLNLEVLKEVNKYYFDDITVYVEQGEEPFFTKDWTTETAYPYWWMGDGGGQNPDKPYFCNKTATVEVVDGACVIANTVDQGSDSALQPYIMDWFNLTEGKNYKVRITMAASAAGKVNLKMGTWGASMDASFEFAASDDFKKYDIEFPTSTCNTTGSDAHILFQGGKFVGTVKIKKIELFEL